MYMRLEDRWHAANHSIQEIQQNISDGREVKEKLCAEEKELNKTLKAFEKNKASHVTNMLIPIKQSKCIYIRVHFYTHTFM